MIDLFRFVAMIFGSIIGFYMNSFMLEDNISVGGFIIVILLICILISKILGMAHSEIEEDKEVAKTIRKEDKISLIKGNRDRQVGGKHNASRVRHGRKD